MDYVKTLEELVRKAPPAVGMTHKQIEASIATITRRLNGPMPNADRLMLCEDRSSLRKALAALST